MTGFPYTPLLVEMSTTPLAAFTPKIAVLEATFNMITYTLSLLFKKVISSYHTPSTTYSGVVLPNTVPKPRILIVCADPGVPLLVMVTPATLPCNALTGLASGCLGGAAPGAGGAAPGGAGGRGGPGPGT